MTREAAAADGASFVIRRPRWLYLLVGLTPLAIAWVEVSRVVGGPVVAPFLTIYTTIAVIAAVVGLRAGIVSAGLVSLYTVYSAFQGFGPVTLTGGALQASVGIVIAFAIAISIGRVTTKQRRLIEELHDTQRRLQLHGESLEAQVADRVVDYRAMTARVFQIQEIERASLARELHDEFGQSLVSLKLLLNMLRTKPDDDKNWKDTKQTIDKLIEQTRSLSLVLHPSMLDRVSLAGSIRRYVEQQAARAGLRYSLEVDTLPKTCAQPTALLLFRCVQESVTNVIKHADASWFGVTLDVAGDAIVLTIDDDGNGFQVPTRWRASELGGFGLAGMQERLHQAGGELEVESLPGSGTRITARIRTGAASAQDVFTNSPAAPQPVAK